MPRARAPGRAEVTTPIARLGDHLGLTQTGLVAGPALVAGWLLAHRIGARAAYLMVYGATLAIVLAWFAARRALAADVERSDLPARMTVGQHVTVDLRIVARRRMNTVVIEETLPARIGRTVRRPIARASAGEEIAERYSFSPSLRGEYRIGPLLATWSDPFGFTNHRQVLAEAADVIVHPAVEPVHDRVLTRMWEDPPIRPPVSKPWPVGFEFYGMRDYIPGDDLRRVVWSVVAKTGRMMVRESEQGITDRVVILLDTHDERHAPGDPSDTFETAVRVAASIGVRHLTDGFAVSLLTNTGPLQTGLRGPRARLDLLDDLARAGMSREPLSASLRPLLAEARARAHVLVVTPHLDAESAGQLRLIVERGVSVVVAHVKWDETDPRSPLRAAAVGCHVVQVPSGAPLDAVFGHSVGGRARR